MWMQAIHEALTAVTAYFFQASACEGLETTEAESVSRVRVGLKKVAERNGERFCNACRTFGLKLLNDRVGTERAD